MNFYQRAALIGMMNAILKVGHVDEFTAFRAHRLLNRLGVIRLA
jgi:hypothetical protein